MKLVIIALGLSLFSSCKRDRNMLLLVSDKTQLNANMQNRFDFSPSWDKELNVHVGVSDSSEFSSLKNEKRILLLTFPNDSTYHISSWIV